MGTRPRLREALIEHMLPGSSHAHLPERAVQFGTGAFLRGFVDDFIHRANQRGLFNGRIVAVGSTGSNRDRALSEQDGLYTLVVRGVERGEIVDGRRIIRSLSRALSAVEEWDAVLQLARSPELELVFSNTTEVGITLSETDQFDDAPPSSFPGKLTRFLFERARAFDFSGHGLVVIPCELIEDNAVKLREIVLALAGRWGVDDRFALWLERDVRFCNTLVDRIVPGAPKGDDAERLVMQLGYEDALLTCCEPYRLFAIQGDAEVRALLPWAAIDDAIIIAPDTGPYRARKLYILNGAHTIFVSLALLLGHETVRGAMEQPEIASFVRRTVFDEIVPTLNVEGATEFAEAVIDRFRNPFIDHALLDITLQTTMKMRLRIVPTIQHYMEQRGEVPQMLALGFAAFLHYKLEHSGDQQRPDANAAPIYSAADRHGSDVRGFVDDVCADVSLWGTDLSALEGFTEVVALHLQTLRDKGISAVIAPLGMTAAAASR